MVHDIGEWLEQLGLGEYTDMFAENKVDAEVLPSLTNDDLKDIGVHAVGDRRKLQNAIASLGETEDGPTDEPVEALPPETQSSRDAERRQLTVMFCDLVGSTELSHRLDPEDLREVMRRYQDAVSGAVTRYGGHVAKYLGDGVLAYFGWPRAYEDQAERAVRAGLDAVLAVNDVHVGDERALEARVGIATGQVVVGDLVGESGRDAEAVTGETPNLAARLQGVAKPGQVVVGEATYRLVGQAFRLDDLGSLELKGFDDAVMAWAITGEVVAESRFEAAHGARLTRLVGREAELRLLLDRWELAAGGEGQAMLIAGEAGIGKSRLMQGLRDSVRDSVHIPIRYQCSPYHTNSALYPTIEQLERACGFAPDDAGEKKLDKLEALLREAGDDLASDVPLFAGLLSLPYEARHGALALAPQQIKERLLEALLTHLLRLAERSPVLFLFEDAHWIDPTSQELLERIIGRLQEARVLLIITHRPEWHSPFGGHNHVTSLQLNRLGKAQGAEIVRTIAGDFLADNVVERIVQRTDGVPLFVEELTKTLVEGGLTLDETEIPASLQASLMERLDRLGAVKEIAQIGAVIGREVSYALLANVVDNSDADLTAALDRLVQSELMFRRGEASDAVYSFKHALVRDTAYDSLLFASRREWHRRVGEALERDFPSILKGEPEVVAHHWLEAGIPDRAIPLFLRAGRSASERSANKEAVAHLGKALELHDAMPREDQGKEQELEILVALGPALMVVEGFGHPQVGRTWDRAYEACDQARANDSLYLIVWNLWLHHQTAGNLERAAELSSEVIRLTEVDASEEHRLEAHHAVWTTALTRGQLALTRSHCESGVALYAPERHHVYTYSYGSHDPGVCGHSYAGFAFSMLGLLDQALSHGRQAIALAESVGHGPSITIAKTFFSYQCYLRRDPKAALEAAEEAIEAAERFGPAHFRPVAQIGLGWAKVALGQGRDGLVEAEAAVAFYKATGATLRMPGFMSALAEIHLALGDTAKALSSVDDALRLIEGNVETTYRADMTRLKAEILLAHSGNNGEAAEALFNEAMDIAQQQEALLFELRSAAGLARHWRNQDRTAEAHDLLSPIYSRFTEGYGMPDLKDAKALLDELH
ncbi:MAG: AAA family ATPase [Alphaproteobacteria bacterium]|nr:AAA family ATPase [Alphaproteobacteria bacterium]